MVLFGLARMYTTEENRPKIGGMRFQATFSAIHFVVENFPNEIAVQQKGLNALIEMFVLGSEDHQALLRANAASISNRTVATLNRYPQDTLVQCFGNDLLYMASTNIPVSLCKAAVSTMKALPHTNNRSVQATSCNVLESLAGRSEDARIAIREAGGADALLKAIQNEQLDSESTPPNISVLALGLRALENLDLKEGESLLEDDEDLNEID